MLMELPRELVERCQSSLRDHQLEGFLTGAGNEKADVMFIGEAPGEQEAKKSQPFIGRSGKILDTYLEVLGLDRRNVYMTSVVRSRPYRWGERRPKGEPVMRKINRKPTEKEIFAHAPLLDYQINVIQPRMIVCLGGVALKRLLGKKAKISAMHGVPIHDSWVQQCAKDAYHWSVETYTLMALYHPAAVFYNPSLRTVIDNDLQILKEFIRKDHT
ncbi:DNA polymerase [Geomicrobium halophilum]|uniref:Type-4 uracil-DNA glycosylase n=1 Tax=Geomicrobium halophilum TaxID=549000 RepID=A0A841PNV5_9BACL|nr:uracil-DNA glycosylase [Geomicrobium halophilum]MBB6450450.1 DNA polymerase [Geomicrobium halophilum]